MKQVFSFLAGVTIILSSCSSARKAAQTPDDVYYSPGAPAAGYANSANNNHDEYYSTGASDQYVRLKTQDPARWSYFDDYNAYDSYYSPMSSGLGYYGGYSGYGYGSSGLSFGMGLFNPYFGWNNYFTWNTCYNPYFYNPYYGGAVIVVGGGKGGFSAPVYNHVRAFNPASYRNAGFASGSNTRNRLYRPVTSTSNSYYNTTPRSNSFLSRFSNGNNSGNNNGSYRPANNSSSSVSQPTRSFTPSSSGSSGGGNSGGGGGGGGVSRPGRH